MVYVFLDKNKKYVTCFNEYEYAKIYKSLIRRNDLIIMIAVMNNTFICKSRDFNITQLKEIFEDDSRTIFR